MKIPYPENVNTSVADLPLNTAYPVIDADDKLFILRNSSLIRVNTSGGGIITNRTEVNNVNYGVLLTDYYIAISNLSATRIITLPNTAETGQTFIIGEKSVLWFEATTDTNDTFVSCRFSGIEVRDFDA